MPGEIQARYAGKLRGRGDVGSYQCAVSNVGGSLVTDPVAVELQERPIIVSQPTPAFCLIGEVVSLNVGVLSGSPVAYVWKRNGVVVPGEVSATLSVCPCSGDDCGDFTCVVSNESGDVTSARASVHLRSAF